VYERSSDCGLIQMVEYRSSLVGWWYLLKKIFQNNTYLL